MNIYTYTSIPNVDIPNQNSRHEFVATGLERYFEMNAAVARNLSRLTQKTSEHFTDTRMFVPTRIE